MDTGRSLWNFLGHEDDKCKIQSRYSADQQKHGFQDRALCNLEVDFAELQGTGLEVALKHVEKCWPLRNGGRHKEVILFVNNLSHLE